MESFKYHWGNQDQRVPKIPLGSAALGCRLPGSSPHRPGSISKLKETHRRANTQGTLRARGFGLKASSNLCRELSSPRSRRGAERERQLSQDMWAGKHGNQGLSRRWEKLQAECAHSVGGSNPGSSGPFHSPTPPPPGRP